ncbi:MAG: hypothetical protein FWE11_09285 [Defluviitaleaceae bacterium]|nr:hypothetical protein [Defluviitaleaceae bacterium]
MNGPFGLMPFSRGLRRYGKVSPLTGANFSSQGHIGKKINTAPDTIAVFEGRGAIINVLTTQVNTKNIFTSDGNIIKAYHHLRPSTEAVFSATLFGQKFVFRGPNTATRFRARGHNGKISRISPTTKTVFVNTSSAAVYSRMRPSTRSHFLYGGKLMAFIRRKPTSSNTFNNIASGLLAYLKATLNTEAAFREGSHIGKEMPLITNTNSLFASDTHIGKEIRAKVSSGCKFTQQSYVGKFSLAMPCTFSRFEALSQMIMFEVETAELRAIIPPGATLVIDSDNDALTAMLDGENVLHQYRGAWIRLNRNSYMLDIHAATGGRLETTINYEDRYL